MLVDMLCFDITVATRNHDGFVITTALDTRGTVNRFFVGPKIAVDIGATKFIIKGGGTHRALNHNVQCSNNSIGLAIIQLPGMMVIRQL